MCHPGWTGENEDVGGENLVVQSRPLIAITHVIADAVCDAMIEGSNHLGFDTMLAQCIENDRCQCLRIRWLGAWLQRAVEQQRFHCWNLWRTEDRKSTRLNSSH